MAMVFTVGVMTQAITYLLILETGLTISLNVILRQAVIFIQTSEHGVSEHGAANMGSGLSLSHRNPDALLL
jgi:hypothetical protein